MPSSKKSLVQPARTRSDAGFVLGFCGFRRAMFHTSRRLRSGLIVLRQIAGAGGEVDGAALAMHEIALVVFGVAGVFNEGLLRVALLVDARFSSWKISRCVL